MSYRAEVAGTVDLFELHRHWPERYPFLLQSVAGHPLAGRYDLLFAGVEDWITAVPGIDFFAEISRRAAALPQLPASDLPFVGGWFVLLGYEAARWVEPRLRLPPSPFRVPDALAVRCTAVLIYDRQARQCHLLAERDEAQLAELRRDLATCANIAAQGFDKPCISSISEEPPDTYLRHVRRILDYLRAGDVFQVNPSRLWQARLLPDRSYLDVYRALRRANPAPFAGLARIGGTAIVSSSPERLVEVHGGQVQTRPIAGTRPRGASDADDQRLRERLVESLKERAEHIMLIDLERNDLGRVCEPGSIEVSELMTVESYAHVHHIVSNVRGRLRAGVGPGETLRAVFPGGTITGCPKVRAMEIIAELEGVGRGPYTGAMGYLSRCGRMDLNILIRSLVIEEGGVSFRTGGGIVADSVPDEELAETRAKARGLLQALGAG
jgi:anthranilate synthase component I